MIMENRFYCKYVDPAKTSAAKAHLAEGQFLFEEQILNTEKLSFYLAGSLRPTVSKKE
jgi:hypothetical protein